MKTVNQSYQILECIPGEELKHIEQIGRVCYKSEDKISEDDNSARKFVQMLVEHGHCAMIEHADMAFIMRERMFSQLKKMAYIFETRTGQACQLRFSEKRGALLRYIVSGNMRAWLETLNEYTSREEVENGEECCTKLPSNMIQVFNQYPEIFGDVISACYEDPDDLVETRRIYPDEMTAMEKDIHQTVSVKFITDRGCCYDDETKVLTKDGWKFFKDVSKNDVYYTMDDKNDITFTKAEKIIRKRYVGTMHHWTSTQLDLKVTPNHNMWVFDHEKRTAKSKVWKFVKSEEMTNSRYGFLKAANPIATVNENSIVIPSCTRHRGFYDKTYDALSLDANLFYELLGLWLTDGSISYGKGTSGNRLVISQVKPKIRERIKELLNSLNISYYEEEKGFRLNCVQLFDYVSSNFTHKDDVHKSYYLTLPREFISKLSAYNAEALIKGIIEGNGSKHSRGPGYQIYTASQAFAEDLVELCLLAGKAANIRTISPRKRKFPGKENYSECREQYVVSVVLPYTMWSRQSKSAQKQSEEYNGYVYCVELPIHHRLFVMRNGKACWCGNSHELVRHRPMSFAQESQRYVSYNKEKFGGEISFIDPFTCVTNDAKMAALDDATLFDMKILWERACIDAEKTYMSLIEAGATPQIARSVLPNSTKTEIVMTGNLAEWEHFFKLRCDKAAHPAMRELVIPLKEEFIRRGLLEHDLEA